MKWLNHLLSKAPADFVQWVSPAKLEKLIEAECEEFGDDSPEAQQWEACLKQVRVLLGRYSHDEEAEGADGSPGFLLQDIWQGSLTIGMEFNDPALLSRPVWQNLAEITGRKHAAMAFDVTIFLPGKDPDNPEMENLVITKGVVYAPSSVAVKAVFKTWQ